MFWRKRKPRYTLDEYNALYATVAEKVTEMNAEARKHNMVEQGLLPQTHLSRDDVLKHRQELQAAGRDALGRRLAGTSDPDLLTRDE